MSCAADAAKAATIEAPENWSLFFLDTLRNIARAYSHKGSSAECNCAGCVADRAVKSFEAA